jgi:MFS family permease
LGILEDTKLDHVPATVTLTEQASTAELVSSTTPLKHGKGKDADIILIPQPSDDPNDPLNWPTFKKVSVILIVAFGSTLYGAVIAPLLAAAVVIIAHDLDKSIGDINELSGYMCVVAAASGPFVCALSRRYGKRPLLLGSSLFAVLGSVLGSVTTDYTGFFACRIISGFSISAFESLVISMIGDLFFLHQRGIFMTMIQFTLGVTSNFTSIITGPIATTFGWRYLFHIMIAFASFETIIVFLFVPETSYNRDPRCEIDEIGDTAPTENAEEKDSADVRLESVISTRSYPPKKTFLQELKLWTGETYSDENMFKLIVGPFGILTNLTILWFVFVTGGLAAFLVSQSMVIAQIFYAPPYRLTPAGIGYLSLGPLVGGILASLAVGATIDPFIKWCARKNGGVYEPEYRLLFMIPSLLAGVGLVLFGYICENKKSLYLAAFMHGIDIFGIVAGSIAAATYVIDAFRDMSSELFIINMLTKNLIIFAFSTFVNDWMKETGPATVYNMFGGIAFGLVATTPVVFYYGKRYRSFWHRYNVMEMLHIRTHAEI